MKRPPVSITELVKEIEEGTWHATKPETRAAAVRMITAMVAKVQERKLAAPRRILQPKGTKLITLEQWEAAHGKLTLANIEKWRQDKQYCPVILRGLIEEFRIDMMSKGKLYANFGLAFMAYVNHGYLSKRGDQCLIANSPYTGKFKDKEHNHGVQL